MLAPILWQMKQLWKEHSSPLSGRTGALCFPRERDVGHAGSESPELPAPEVPACAGSGASLLGSRRSCCKPLLMQSSLLMPGPLHLLGCLSDDSPGVPNEILSRVLFWVKPAGKDLQSREGQELVLGQEGRALLDRKLEGAQEKSPGNRCGHRA